MTPRPWSRRREGDAGPAVGWGDAMSRKRWIKRLLTGVLAFGSAGGCKQQLFMEPADYRDAVMNTLPRSLENAPHATMPPNATAMFGLRPCPAYAVAATTTPMNAKLDPR